MSIHDSENNSKDENKVTPSPNEKGKLLKDLCFLDNSTELGIVK